MLSSDAPTTALKTHKRRKSSHWELCSRLSLGPMLRHTHVLWSDSNTLIWFKHYALTILILQMNKVKARRQKKDPHGHGTSGSLFQNAHHWLLFLYQLTISINSGVSGRGLCSLSMPQPCLWTNQYPEPSLSARNSFKSKYNLFKNTWNYAADTKNIRYWGTIICYQKNQSLPNYREKIILNCMKNLLKAVCDTVLSTLHVLPHVILILTVKVGILFIPILLK